MSQLREVRIAQCQGTDESDLSVTSMNDFESGQVYFETALKYDPDFVMVLHNRDSFAGKGTPTSSGEEVQ